MQASGKAGRPSERMRAVAKFDHRMGSGARGGSEMETATAKAKFAFKLKEQREKQRDKFVAK